MKTKPAAVREKWRLACLPALCGPARWSRNRQDDVPLAVAGS